MDFSHDQIRAWLGILLILAVSDHRASCSKAVPIDEVAYTIPERLKLKSSTAQASRIIAELKGGDRITIRSRANADDGTPWVRIIGPGGESGWAEARFFVKVAIVDESRHLAEKVKDTPTQAIGRSKAALKLRLTPDRANDANVAVLLPSGTPLEIVGREHKPRPSVPIGDDEAEMPGKKKNEKMPEIKYDDWLLVRIKDSPVLPAGWIYGGSVILEIPPEIIYFKSDGRRITGWQKIGTVGGNETRAGDHYLVVERRIFDAEEQVDFDRVKVLAYDPATRSYSIPFLENLEGRFPVTLNMEGNQGQFQLNAFDKEFKPVVVNYKVEILSDGRVNVARIDEKKPEKSRSPVHQARKRR